MDYAQEALKRHYQWQGKIEVSCRAPLETREDLSLAYTPGVAQPCLEIQRDPEKSWELTRRGNLVAVVTDGTAVLGLGDIGPEAGMPVMEGKCALFKAFAGVDAFPLCVRSKDVEEIVRTVSLLAGSFGGINLEDIAAPRCFEIEEKLKAVCDIPVFHDDQHGTAVVVLAALLNAMKLTGKGKDARIVVIGGGAAGTAIAGLIAGAGYRDLLVVDRVGILNLENAPNPHVRDLLGRLKRQDAEGTLADALKGADVMIGVSAPGIVTEEMVASMNRDAIVLAMANPVPEIMPELAKRAGARIVGTGRSDYANQINNVLAFPGIFRGALDARARDINHEMQLAAARAIADYLPEGELGEENLIPSALDRGVSRAVAEAVADAARRSGVARK